MDQNYNNESNAVRWSIVVLCISLSLVYVVLYYVKWDVFKWSWNDVLAMNDSWLIVSEISDKQDYSMKTDTWNITVPSQTSWLFNNSDWSANYNVWSGSNIWNTDVEVSDNQWGLTIVDLSNPNSNSNVNSSLSEMIVLSWTHTYYWDLDFVNLLWISYKYALTDSKWIYYLNMDGYTYDFSDIARKLWWNLYIMNTESEILANKMFGNKVTYINIPEYANKKVLMLIDVNNQSRLLAVDYPIYHASKSYLQSLFIY